MEDCHVTMEPCDSIVEYYDVTMEQYTIVTVDIITHYSVT